MRGAVHENHVRRGLTVTIQRGRLGPKLHELLSGVVPVSTTHTGGLDRCGAGCTIEDGLDLGFDRSGNRSGATKDDDVLNAVDRTVQDRLGAS